MKREDPYRVQADLQKKRIQRMEKEKEANDSLDELPSRSSVHRNKKKKKKSKTPILSLLVGVFILLPIGFILVTKAIEEKWYQSLLPTSFSPGSFEEVSIVKEKPSISLEKQDIESDNEKETNTQPEVPKETENKETKNPNTEATDSSTQDKTNETDKVDQPTNSTNQEQPKKETTDSASKEDKTEEPTNSTTEESDKKEEASTDKVIYHTVAKGETLYRISMKYYHSPTGIDIIKQNNNIAGNEIQAGQKIKIVLQGG